MDEAAGIAGSRNVSPGVFGGIGRPGSSVVSHCTRAVARVVHSLIVSHRNRCSNADTFSERLLNSAIVAQLGGRLTPLRRSIKFQELVFVEDVSSFENQIDGPSQSCAKNG